ncbi:MAG: hypothetical protein IAE63_08610 [Alphaproteobacteria bacterium]|nr:hypothetical protein [Alphaproteobacteria bacterium]
MLKNEITKASTIGEEEFKEFVIQLHNISRTYDGSAQRRDMFAKAISAIKTFISPFAEHNSMSESECLSSFAQKYHTVFGQDFRLQRFYDMAFQSMIPDLPQQEESPTNIVALLEKIESLRVEADVFEQAITLGISDSQQVVGYYPRLACVLQVLFDQGTCLQDVSLQFNKADSVSDLNAGYILISIPDRNCQILVSDRQNRPAYWHNGIKSREFWLKNNLKSLSAETDTHRLEIDTLNNLYKSLAENLPECRYLQVPGYVTRNNDLVPVQTFPIPLEKFWDLRRDSQTIYPAAFPALNRETPFVANGNKAQQTRYHVTSGAEMAPF